MKAVALLRGIGVGLQRIPRSLAPLLVAAWMVLIWYRSSIPGESPSSHVVWSAARNFLHAPVFGFLALLGVLCLPRTSAWPRMGRGGVACVLAGAIAYALVDEWHQASVPGRVSSLLDCATDLVGAACTLAIIAYLRRPAARDAGLWVRLAVGLASCLAAAVFATIPDSGP
ncbi:MAG: hypothetical protein CMJ84_06895 [Planctomycetes bacterium]|nr:hypothetical protein [Planctomycetota bacterium]MDP6408189.1 VanZ family protein [Planctomycetota bacterium]